MKTVLRIVLLLGVLALAGWLIARLADRGLETVESVETGAEPDEIETQTEELVETPA